MRNWNCSTFYFFFLFQVVSFFFLFFYIVYDFQQYSKKNVKSCLRFFVSLPSTDPLYRAPVPPLPILSSRPPVSGPAVPRNRPTLPMGSRKALVRGWELTRPSSIFFSFGIVRDIVTLVIPFGYIREQPVACCEKALLLMIMMNHAYIIFNPNLLRYRPFILDHFLFFLTFWFFIVPFFNPLSPLGPWPIYPISFTLDNMFSLDGLN